MAPTFAAKAAAGASLLHHLELLTPVILMFYLAALPSLADSLPIQRKFMPDDRDFQSFSEAATAQKLTRDCVGANHHHHQRVLQLMLPLKYQTEKVIGKSAEFHGNHANVVAERRKKTSKRKRKKECREELLIKNKFKFKLIKERRKRTSDVYVNSVDNLNLNKIRNKEKIWENFKYNLSENRNNSFNHENHEIVFLNEAENFTSTTSSYLDKETVEGNSEFSFSFLLVFKMADLRF